MIKKSHGRRIYKKLSCRKQIARSSAHTVNFQVEEAYGTPWWLPMLEAYISVWDSFTQGANICDTLVGCRYVTEAAAMPLI